MQSEDKNGLERALVKNPRLSVQEQKRRESHDVYCMSRWISSVFSALMDCFALSTAATGTGKKKMRENISPYRRIFC